MRNRIITCLLIIFFSLVLWYFMLPPLNITSPMFWSYLFTIILFSIAIISVNTLMNTFSGRSFKFKITTKTKIFIGSIVSVLILILGINFFCSPLFNASSYSKRIIIDEDKEFIEGVAEVDFSKIPLLDKDSSQRLGDRKMGQATEWVSQFYVSDLYTQINYNDEILRVTPIEYASIIKYFTNRKEGIKGYITVDSVDGEAKLINLEDGMKYMPSAYFFENLERKLRISYPFTIFDQASFEIDNEGHPYWIVPTIKYSGVGLKKEVSGVVILDACTGKSKKYKIGEIPSWVDHVYSAELILEQLNNWGEYKEGFFNSIFGQKNVVNTTEGYNYLVMNDDVYLYTGITSVSSDESNLGFVLVNLRTKQTNYYSVPGAEEYSAMASAEGLVQEKSYEASFPLLINLNNKPTYLMSLKDDAGLVKMYAFVDVEDYQKVVVSDAALGIDEAAEKYLQSENTKDIKEENNKTIKIKSIKDVVIDGNTYYYITDEDNLLYYVSIKVNSKLLPFVSVGDKVKVSFIDNSVKEIIKIEVENE